MYKYCLFYPKYPIKIRIREMFEPIADSLEEGIERAESHCGSGRTQRGQQDNAKGQKEKKRKG